MAGTSVLNGTQSVGTSDLGTHDFSQKSHVSNYCDASCAQNVGQFIYYDYIMEKVHAVH